MLWPTWRRFLLPGLFLLLVLLAGMRPRTSAAPAATIARVSVSSTGEQANALSSPPVLSADGRFVAFHSTASNLTPDDGDEAGDVFVHDRQTGQTRRISFFPPGIEGTLDAAGPAITPDGRFIVFWTSVRAGPPANLWNIYLHDQLTGTTELIPVRGVGGGNPDRGGIFPSISGDGRFVTFQTAGENLVSDDTNGSSDIYLFDRLTARNERISISSTGAEGDDQSTLGSISADGRYVAFVTDTDNLVPNDTNRGNDILVRDRQMGETRRISLGPNGEQDPYGDAYAPTVSFSGRYVLYNSSFSALAPGDTNGMKDVFVFDQQTGQTVRVSEPVGGGETDWESTSGAMSADERFVTFSSYATNLVPNDRNEQYDVFVREYPAGAIERVSVGTGGAEANDHSSNSVISADGRYIAFLSTADNLVPGDTNGVNDVFVADRGPITPPVTLTGTVHDTDGQPLPGVSIRDWRGYAAQTDETGRFAIADLPPGVYTLEASRFGYTFRPPAWTVSSSTNTEPAFIGVAGQFLYLPHVINKPTSRTWSNDFSHNNYKQPSPGNH